ncbi:hypothetical protein GQ53DRAFT_154647 [Thozetella sp. PMI_491]|nr:hypothetical protein GQ53DRAFT_154647 [Thozetella sp. PMI_491]
MMAMTPGANGNLVATGKVSREETGSWRLGLDGPATMEGGEQGVLCDTGNGLGEESAPARQESEWKSSKVQRPCLQGELSTVVQSVSASTRHQTVTDPGGQRSQLEEMIAAQRPGRSDRARGLSRPERATRQKKPPSSSPRRACGSPVASISAWS